MRSAGRSHCLFFFFFLSSSSSFSPFFPRRRPPSQKGDAACLVLVDGGTIGCPPQVVFPVLFLFEKTPLVLALAPKSIRLASKTQSVSIRFSKSTQGVSKIQSGYITRDSFRRPDGKSFIRCNTYKNLAVHSQVQVGFLSLQQVTASIHHF